MRKFLHWRWNRIIGSFIIFLLLVGGVSSGLVLAQKDIVNTEAYTSYEKSLLKAGFPESYLPYLVALHKEHPTWTFEAVQTGLDWAEVITNEMVLFRNLVPKNIMTLKGVDSNWYATPTSWKEVELPGSFAWAKVETKDRVWINEWITYSGDDSWVQASEAAVEYVMDPRNWMTENNIFEFECLSYKEDISENVYLAALQRMLKYSFMDGTTVGGSGGLTYAEVILKAGQTYGVSPISLCARLIQEKGRGTLSDGTYKITDTLAYGVVSDDGGTTFRKRTSDDEKPYYYNFFNIGASGHTTQDVINNGGKEAMNAGWTSRYKAIMGGAEKFAVNYVNSEIGQDTLYFQKFSVIVPEYYYWKQYMQNITAPINEGYSVRTAYADNGLLECSFLFKIPVYENMPETACENPSVTYGTSTANPNYKLSSLEVTGKIDGKTVTYALTPSFDLDTLTYSIEVPYALKSVTITAKAYASDATITGDGEHELAVGNNTIKIKCTSAYGTYRKYKINILRAAGATLLSSLSIKKQTLNEEFVATTLYYSADVDATVDAIDIKMKTFSSTAYCVLRYGETQVELGSGTLSTGSLALAEGENVFYIDVYPASDDLTAYSTYQVTVTKHMDTVMLTDYQYTDTTINGFTVGDTVETALANIRVLNGTAKILDANKEEKATTDIIKTNDCLILYDNDGNQVGKKHYVILYGDVNGDGIIDIMDMAIVKNYVWYTGKLKGKYLLAADAYHDEEGAVDIMDMAVLKNYVWYEGNLRQTK